jgi:hypothetical protein
LEEKVRDLRLRCARRTNLTQILRRKNVPDDMMRVIFGYTGYDV